MAARIQKTTLMRQIDRGEIPAENVIALARAHGVNAIDALVDLGYLLPEEVALAGVPTALGHATNGQILEEIHRRVDPEAVRVLRGGGDPDVITPRFSDETEGRSADQAKQWPPILGRKVAGPSTREESDGRGNLG